MGVLDQQMLLHDAASLCAVALLRPASLSPEELMPILGLDLRRDALLEALGPALDIAWPDRPAEADDLDRFLKDARREIVDAAVALGGVDGYVPAALWTDAGRELLLEHLCLDMAMLVGGVRAEGLWFAFGETPDTESLGELIVAGMLIKLRAVGAFLIQKPSTRDDELAAAQFFSAGAWELARDVEITQRVLRLQLPVHKQVAHLTVSRPQPDELGVYRPSTYRPMVADLLALLEQFSEHVDERLIPSGWRGSIASLRPRLDVDNWP
jgi:hypothetical protein